MTRIDQLLQRATPNVPRRERLRGVHAEWEQVKSAVSRRSGIHIPLLVREERQPDDAGLVIAAADSDELQQIREELAEAGVPAKVQPSV